MMNVAYMNVMVADYKNKMACVLPRLRKIEEAGEDKEISQGQKGDGTC